MAQTKPCKRIILYVPLFWFSYNCYDAPLVPLYIIFGCAFTRHHTTLTTCIVIFSLVIELVSPRPKAVGGKFLEVNLGMCNTHRSATNEAETKRRQ